MNQYTIFAVAFGVFVGFFTSASALPVVLCHPSTMQDLPLKARQMCFALFDNIEIAAAAPPPSLQEELPNNVPEMDNHVYARGAKRQDVDHVFLRFGRRYGL